MNPFTIDVVRHRTNTQNFYSKRSAFLALVLLFILASCQIYQSPDRRDFENDRPQAQALGQNQGFRTQSCGTESIEPLADQSRLIYSDDSIRITENKIGNITVLESENQQGDYCVLVQ